jgi:hypothetical protein
MAIDVLSEEPFSLAQAAKLPFLPRRRKGRKPNVATLYRWSSVGCRGVVLESVECGGCRCTTAQAIIRFFAKLTAQAAGQPPETRIPKHRERAVLQAEKELDEAGIR